MARTWQRWLAAFCGLIALAATAPADDWPQFRGPRRDNISRETGLLRAWPEGGPKVLWSVEVCQGYAAAAIHGGRVYFNDYDREANEWCVRCLTLEDGQELWRFKESKRIRPNHGITRTVPAVDGKYVFSLDPKCVLHCLDADSGEPIWRKSLVKEYKSRIPPWYNGQCPLIEPDRVIIALGGEALMVALDKATGREIWRAPNPHNWPLSHSSVMPAELGGIRQYLWCTLFGPLGVSAADGALLWFHPRKFNVAVSPSPLALADDRVFMTGPYDAGSLMLRVRNAEGRLATETIFDWPSGEWSSEVHTPIVFDGHMFAVGKKKRGLLTCLDLDGNVVWTSADKASFGLGSFILADGMFYVLEGKTGMLRLLEANTTEYRELDSAQVLSGHDVWGPMALSDGKLVLRDMTKMVCIEVGSSASTRNVEDGPALGTTGCAPPYQAVSREPKMMQYSRVRLISGAGSEPEHFAEVLRGLAVDSTDRLYAVGDSTVKVFSPAGELLRSWSTEKPGYSVAVAADGTVYVGQAGQVQVFDAAGKLLDTWRDADKLGLVTAIGFSGDYVLIADTAGRCIRRCDKRGKFLNNIGKNGRGFAVPNRHLDFAVDGEGVIHAANPGLHRVQRYTVEGKLLGHFGRFTGRDPTGFTGCCNPTNIALTPGGRIVVTVKSEPYVKVYDVAGKLLAVFGQQDFDPTCKNMDVAVDSKGRIYVVETTRRHICVYEPAASTTSQPVNP